MIEYEKLVLQTRTFSLLLVEDYEPLRKDMAELLEDLFHTVVVAKDGSEALQYYKAYSTVKKKNFDIVISDIQMPIMDGVALSEALRKLCKEQSIIILSANKESDNLLRLINLGISKFVTKPIEYDELLDALSEESVKIHDNAIKSKTNLYINLGKNYIWDKNKSLLSQADVPVKLTRHEILLFKFFIDKEEQICSTADIMQYFYENNINIYEENIRNLVFKLRKKIPKECISSIYGLGYKFKSCVDC